MILVLCALSPLIGFQSPLHCPCGWVLDTSGPFLAELPPNCADMAWNTGRCHLQAHRHTEACLLRSEVDTNPPKRASP